jgi:hypothetical protein
MLTFYYGNIKTVLTGKRTYTRKGLHEQPSIRYRNNFNNKEKKITTLRIG